jgi:hypothetical protein
MAYNNMIICLFCFDEIDRNLFNGAQITDNIKYATHIVIKKELDLDFRIMDIATFYKEANIYVIELMKLLLKKYTYDNMMWKMTTFIIKNITLGEKSDLELNNLI